MNNHEILQSLLVWHLTTYLGKIEPKEKNSPADPNQIDSGNQKKEMKEDDDPYGDYGDDMDYGGYGDEMWGLDDFMGEETEDPNLGSRGPASRKEEHCLLENVIPVDTKQ